MVDREVKSSYVLVITAADGGVPVSRTVLLRHSYPSSLVVLLALLITSYLYHLNFFCFIFIDNFFKIIDTCDLRCPKFKY